LNEVEDEQREEADEDEEEEEEEGDHRSFHFSIAPHVNYSMFMGWGVLELPKLIKTYLDPAQATHFRPCRQPLPGQPHVWAGAGHPQGKFSISVTKNLPCGCQTPNLPLGLPEVNCP
jgi:hypothetical protein